MVSKGLIDFFVGCYILVTIYLCVVVLRSRIKIKSKLIWLVLLLSLPVLGVFFYIISRTFYTEETT